MEQHRAETMRLRGNDLRFNIYLRKLNKLARKDLGIDVEAYKDYINNLKQFAHVNTDMQLYAADKLIDKKQKVFIKIDYNKPEGLNEQESELYKSRLDAAFNVIKKLRKKARAFLSEHE